jgi:O-antigen/teichoic acid export membrane protein
MLLRASIWVAVTRVSLGSIAPFVVFASRFGRTVILSRSFPPAVYGVVVAVTTIYTILDAIIDIGLDRFVMINTGDRRAAAVVAAQQIAFVRGLIAMVIVGAFAPALAAIFGAESHVESVRWLALLPVVRSLANLRVKQVLQEYRNGPETFAAIASQVAALVVLFPAVALFEDERAMLASLYADSIVYVAATWLVLPREKATVKVPNLRRDALIYGLPLIVNGAGLLVVSQADKLLVGNLFGLETLALYSLVVNLALIPLAPLGAAFSNLSIALLTERQDIARSGSRAFAVSWMFLVVASAYAACVAVLLDVFVPLLYGARYVATPEVKVLVALLAFIRFSRQGPMAVLLVAGRTSRLAAANLMAGIGLVIGYAFGSLLDDLPAVLAGIVTGDALATLFIFVQIRQRLPAKAVFVHAILLALPVAAACAFSLLDGGGPLWRRGLILLPAMMLVGFDLVVGRRIRPLADQSPRPVPAA